MTRPRRICSTCGAPYEPRAATKSGARAGTGTAQCLDCQPAELRHRKVYDAAWDRLSKRARKLQPFCSDCHGTDDLTCDHTPEAWERMRTGRRIRLQDVDVVCRTCNTRRGAARGEDVRHHRITGQCPVCGRAVLPTERATIAQHFASYGGPTCPMSGERFTYALNGSRHDTTDQT